MDKTIDWDKPQQDEKQREEEERMRDMYRDRIPEKKCCGKCHKTSTPDLKTVLLNKAEKVSVPSELFEKAAERLKGSTRFHELLNEIGELHDQKQRDYGRDNDPFANVRGSQEWGIKPWVGAMLRATDKIKRLQNYARTGQLSNEGAKDSFEDLAVYALIALILHEEEGSK